MSESVTSVSQHDVLSHVENNILLEFVDVAESLIRRFYVIVNDPHFSHANVNPSLILTGQF